MEYNNLLSKNEAGLLIVTINRPEKLNALNKETIAELSELLTEAEKNNDVKALLLTGSVEKAFVAGADIKEFSNFNIEQGQQLASLGQKSLFDKVENLSKPVIAAVNGFALGGGLELAMAAHFRIASKNAKMGLPECSLGLIPGYGGTQRLSKLIGKGKAMEMIMTSQMLDAESALKLGLVNYVVEQGELIDLGKDLYAKMRKNSMQAISAAIKAINASDRNDVNGYDIEIEEFGKCFGTDDFKEGTTAFLEKRKANF